MSLADSRRPEDIELSGRKFQTYVFRLFGASETFPPPPHTDSGSEFSPLLSSINRGSAHVSKVLTVILIFDVLIAPQRVQYWRAFSSIGADAGYSETMRREAFSYRIARCGSYYFDSLHLLFVNNTSLAQYSSAGAEFGLNPWPTYFKSSIKPFRDHQTHLTHLHPNIDGHRLYATTLNCATYLTS